MDDISAPDFICANTFAGEVASGIKDGTGGGGGGVKPLLNDCGPRPGLKPVGSSVHDVNKHQSDVNMMTSY